MISQGDLNKVIQAALKADPYYNDVNVTRGQLIPDEDPSSCPWLGIYRKRTDYDPASIGYAVDQAGVTDNWRGVYQVTLVLLESDLGNDVETLERLEDKIEARIKYTVAFFKRDTTIRQHVDLVRSIAVSYFYNYREATTLYVQGALIDLTLEVIGS